MSIEDIIRAWKTNEDALEPCPVGRELTTRELSEIMGGACGLTNEPLCAPDRPSVRCADVQVTQPTCDNCQPGCPAN